MIGKGPALILFWARERQWTEGGLQVAFPWALYQQSVHEKTVSFQSREETWGGGGV